MSENLRSSISLSNSKPLDQVQVKVGKNPNKIQKQNGPILDLLTSKFNHDAGTSNHLPTITDRTNEDDEKLTLNNINTITSVKESERSSNNAKINLSKISPNKILKKEKTTTEKSTYNKTNLSRASKSKLMSHSDFKAQGSYSYENEETFSLAKIAEKSTNIREDNINITTNSSKVKNSLSHKNSNRYEDQLQEKTHEISNLINLQKMEKESIYNNHLNPKEKDSKLIVSDFQQSPKLQSNEPLRNVNKGKSVKIRPKFFSVENQIQQNGEIFDSQNVNNNLKDYSEASNFNNIHTVNIKLNNAHAVRHNRTSSHNNSTNLTNLNININFQQIIPDEKFTNSSKLNRNYKNAKIAKNKSSSKTPKTKNLQNSEVDQGWEIDGEGDGEDKQELKRELEDYCDNIDSTSRIKIPTDQNNLFPNSPGRNSSSTPGKNWKKISNLFRTMKSLHRYETKNLIDESGFDCEMKDYKERLFDNTKKMRVEKNENDEEDNPDESKSLFDTELLELIQQQVQGDDKKINYKEEIYRIIVDGDTTAVDKIDKLFRSDPEYYLRDENDPNFKFNTPLSNGKTLLYIACQEGKIDVVSYLLEKKINAFVKSKLDAKDGESPLGVAARWNYANIVSLLLEKVQYRKEHILEVLDMQGLTKRIRKTLKRHYKVNFKISKFGCCG